MQIIEIMGYNARCQAKGIERDVSLFMLQRENLDVGDHVMVHVGYAIQKISAKEAHLTWELLDQITDNDASSG